MNSNHNTNYANISYNNTNDHNNHNLNIRTKNNYKNVINTKTSNNNGSHNNNNFIATTHEHIWKHMSKRTQSINHLFFCWRCDSLACRNRILIFRTKGIMWTCVHNVWGKISIWTWWTPCFFHHIGFGVTHIWHIMPFYHDLFKPGDAFFFKVKFFFSGASEKAIPGCRSRPVTDSPEE